MEELKSCPFCDGKAEYTKVGNTKMGYREATIRCTRCGVQRKQKFKIRKFDFDWIDETMIGNWNRRVIK